MSRVKVFHPWSETKHHMFGGWRNRKYLPNESRVCVKENKEMKNENLKTKTKKN